MLDLHYLLVAMLGPSPPSYEVAALVMLLLYVIQSEIRFGARARSLAGGAGVHDRSSTIALSLASVLPLVGSVLAMKMRAAGHAVGSGIQMPGWLIWPGSEPTMAIVAWMGVSASFVGLFIRLWAVLTLRKRYTSVLLIHEDHTIEQGGPYRFVRHPGYLGSLLCLNGLALVSLSAATILASLLTTGAAYAYRIHVEDRMLVAAFGEPYETYRRNVGAVLPFVLLG